MAENEPPAEPPTPPAGLPALPARPVPPSTPAGIDADEYQRFQEFQRFQDYQRHVEAQGAPPHHHELMSHVADMRQQLARIERIANPPLWQKILRNKWLHRAVFLVLIVVLATWGVPQLIHHYVGSNDANQSGLHPGEVQGSGRLYQNPQDAVAEFYHTVATTPPNTACLVLTQAGQDQFAHDVGSTDCLNAVNKIHNGLGATGQNAYYGVLVPDTALTRTGGTAEISSCRLTLSAGPRLGAFILTQNQFNEWQITGHRTEPDPCPAIQPSGSTPPT